MSLMNDVLNSSLCALCFKDIVSHNPNGYSKGNKIVPRVVNPKEIILKIYVVKIFIRQHHLREVCCGFHFQKMEILPSEQVKVTMFIICGSSGSNWEWEYFECRWLGISHNVENKSKGWASRITWSSQMKYYYMSIKWSFSFKSQIWYVTIPTTNVQDLLRRVSDMFN